MGQKGKRSRPSVEKIMEESGPCTYDMGHVRQDVWICVTCNAKDQMAGICGACAIACHGSSAPGKHKLVNLYAKRGFRCDCGNSRMTCACILRSGKEATNAKNTDLYNHNFQERYCRCDQGLQANLGGMEQCCMCEDWFHHKCINAAGLSKSNRAKLFRKAGLVYEFTCSSCVDKLPALRRYYAALGFAANKLLTLPKTMTAEMDMVQSRPANCELPKTDISKLPGGVDILWKEGFRRSLCTCSECDAAYAAANLSFMTSLPDIEGELTEAADVSEEVLDATDDAEILNDVIAEEETAGDASGASHGEKDCWKDSRRLKAWRGGEAHIAIQSRIHRFLESVIASDGEGMTEKELFAYAADLKAEVQASAFASEKASPSEDASARD